MADLVPITFSQLSACAKHLWVGVIDAEQGDTAHDQIEHVANTAFATVLRDIGRDTPMPKLLWESTTIDQALKQSLHHYQDRGVYRLLVSRVESMMYGDPKMYELYKPGVYTIMLWLHHQYTLPAVVYTLRTTPISIEGEQCTVDMLVHGAQPTVQTALLWAFHDAVAHFAYDPNTPWAWQEPLLCEEFLRQIAHPDRLQDSVMCVSQRLDRPLEIFHQSMGGRIMEHVFGIAWEDRSLPDWSETITGMLEVMEDFLQFWTDVQWFQHQHTQDVYTVLHGIVTTVQSRYALQNIEFRYAASSDKFETLYEHVHRFGNPFAIQILHYGKYPVRQSMSWSVQKHYVLTPVILLWLGENGVLDAVVNGMRQHMPESPPRMPRDTVHQDMLNERVFHVLVLLTVYAAIVRRPVDDSIPWAWQQVQYAQDMVDIVQEQDLSVLAQQVTAQMRSDESADLFDIDDAW